MAAHHVVPQLEALGDVNAPMQSDAGKPTLNLHGAVSDIDPRVLQAERDAHEMGASTWVYHKQRPELSDPHALWLVEETRKAALNALTPRTSRSNDDFDVVLFSPSGADGITGMIELLAPQEGKGGGKPIILSGDLIRGYGHESSMASGPHPLSRAFEFARYTADDNGELHAGHILRRAEAVNPDVLVIAPSGYPYDFRCDVFQDLIDRDGGAKMRSVINIFDGAHTAGPTAAGLARHPLTYPAFHGYVAVTHKASLGNKGAAGVINTRRVVEVFQATNRAIGDYHDVLKRVDTARLGGADFPRMAAMKESFRLMVTDERRELMTRILDNARGFTRSGRKEGLNFIGDRTSIQGRKQRSPRRQLHMALIDTRDIAGVAYKDARIPAAHLRAAGILVDVRHIPHETGPNGEPLGIRIGFICATQQGFTRTHMKPLAAAVRMAATGDVVGAREMVGRLCTAQDLRTVPRERPDARPINLSKHRRTRGRTSPAMKSPTRSTARV